MTGLRVKAHPATELCSVHPWHHPVADDDVHLMLGEPFQSLDAVAGRDDLIFVMEVIAEEGNHIFRVVDDEHGLPLVRRHVDRLSAVDR